MTDQAKLNSLWEKIDPEYISSSKTIFENNIDALTEFVIEKTLCKPEFEIGIFEDGRQSGSAISFRETQKEIELRMKKNSTCELVLILEDAEGKQIVLKDRLSKEILSLIPKELRRLMYNVMGIERPVTFNTALI